MIQRVAGYLRAVWSNRRRCAVQPRFLTYAVTYRCNARCVMCDSWKMNSSDDLTIDQVDRIFTELPRMDAVRLTGGEPFVRADLPEIADLARQHLQPLVLHVTTNGFLTDRIVRFCEQRDRRLRLHVLVSIDGVGDKHNQIRGSSRAWDSALQTVRMLAVRRRQWNLRLGVNQTVVDAEGAEQYRQLRDVLRPLGVRNNLVMAYDTSSTYNVQSEADTAPRQVGAFTTFGEFSDQTLHELLRAAEADLRGLPLAERLAKRYYLRGIRNRLLHSRGTPNPPCVALHAHLRLLPDGSVPTCQFNGRKVGDLHEQSLDAVWNGAAAVQQRSWVRRCPGCWAECEVLPSAIYTLDLLRAALPANG
jgi:MoaA/NifB/PqqE/SkfB family radical SAM enzyme